MRRAKVPVIGLIPESRRALPGFDVMADGSATEDSQGPVSSLVYDDNYFRHECEGHEEFVASGGQILSTRLMEALTRADVRPGMHVLDAGCGRGESLVWLGSRQVEAWGVDYSAAALHLAAGALSQADPAAQSAGGSPLFSALRPPRGQGGRLLSANVRQLPFAAQAFDRVLMLDIVEHLHPSELRQALKEAWRVLKPGGKLLVHTAPNLWYYLYGYPAFRLFERLRGVPLPHDPRDRFRYHRQVHVNEQSPTMLRRALRDAGFRPRIWLADIQRRWADRGRLACILGWLATHAYPFRWVFCGDILGEARKD